MKLKLHCSISATLLAMAIAALPAHAAGINISWDECGEYGVINRVFDCTTNSGTPFIAIASFYPPSGIAEFLGIASRIDIFTNQGTLPDWWRHGAGQCRGTSGLNVGFDFTLASTVCQDFYQGAAVGGFAYAIGTGGPSRARLTVQAAVPFDSRGPVDPDIEYYAYKVNLQRSKSSGTGSCAGCFNPTCIILVDIQLYQPPAAGNDPVISNPVSRSYITWQPPPSGPPGCPQSTTARLSTWGVLKSLYR
jgi:hypothetical protein